MHRATLNAMKSSTLGAALLLTLSGCDGSSVEATTLAELAADPRAYSGRQVRVSGTLRSYPEPLHYWIEDERPNRVGVEFHEPLERWVGQPVEVQGRFSYQLSAGRQIVVDRLVPLSASDSRQRPPG